MPVDSLENKEIPSQGQPAGRVGDDPLDHLLVKIDDPWYVSLVQQVRDKIHPPQLPPLELTSKPAEVQSIWGAYRNDKVSRITSIAIHAVVVALLIIPFRHQIVEVAKKTTLFMPANLSDYIAPAAAKRGGGGGGGGDRSPTPAPKGKLPKFALEQKAPPEVVVKVPEPKLPVEPTVVAPPDMKIPNVNLPQFGDQLAKMMAPSNGTGFGGGIGSGNGGGVGSGSGGGVGPGEGGGYGGGVFRVGGGVTAPQLVSKVEPEYSEQARKSKYQGTVTLSLIVQKDGNVRDIKVIQPLGLGLDEKAIEAVKQWRFRPGLKNGVPVDVMATVEVTFRLL